MLEADLTNTPLLLSKDAKSNKLAYLEVEPGMTLISCAGQVLGRVFYARPDMKGFWSSQDLIKVVADRNKIFPGYLNAFLKSRFGIPVVNCSIVRIINSSSRASAYRGLAGAAVRSVVEEEIHGYVQAAADLRAQFPGRSHRRHARPLRERGPSRTGGLPLG